MKISDALNEEELSRLAAKTIKIGDVYEITMTEVNGIKPKRGDKSRDKYFVVLGFDSNGIAYGGVIINSQINKIFRGILKCITCQSDSLNTHSSNMTPSLIAYNSK